MIFNSRRKESIQKLEKEWKEQLGKMDKYVIHRKLISKYLGNSNDEVMIMDDTGVVVSATPGVRKETGYSSKDLKRFKGIYEFTQLTIDQVSNLIKEAKEHKTTAFETVVNLKAGGSKNKKFELNYDSGFYVCIAC